jgi:hypothetical protein
VPVTAALHRAERYARETVPAFNAYLYFRIGYWLGKRFAQLLYLGDQWRTERGAAVGQKRLSPKQTLDESTQASERPGALQPTLGGSVGAKSETPTRVALLSERIL